MATLSPPPSIRVRLTICLIVGVAVFLLSLNSAWNSAIEDEQWPQIATQRALKWTRKELEKVRSDTGHWPETLPVRHLVRDGWNRALVYDRVGSLYQLKSHGADGLPGGEGIDSDLSMGNEDLSNRDLTPRQFLAGKHGCQALAICLTAGLATLIGLMFSREMPFLPLLLSILVTGLLAQYMAIILQGGLFVHTREILPY